MFIIALRYFSCEDGKNGSYVLPWDCGVGWEISRFSKNTPDPPPLEDYRAGQTEQFSAIHWLKFWIWQWKWQGRER